MRIESDEFDFLAPAYVRSFVKTYARFLHLDPAPLVEEFDRRYGSARLETSQIAALERRSKQAPKQGRFNSWAVAAVLALGVLVTLSAIGLATDPEEDDTSRRNVATADETPDVAESETDDAGSPTPEPEESIIAFTEGIELEVIAAKAASWLEVYADGEQLFYKVLPEGDNMTFSADEKMYIRLGYPAGVELIVNGKNIGSPGGENPVDLVLPDDVESAF